MALSPTTRTVFLGYLLLTPACGDDDDDDGSSEETDSMNDGSIRDGGPGDAGNRDGSSPAQVNSMDGGGTSPQMSFFVSSEKSMTGNLGGLSGADARCQRLAAAVGAGSKTWRAYLSVERDPANDNMPTHARDRIGNGPWYNAKGVAVANDLNALHALASGNADLFVDERGAKINGQWPGSPTPVEHDILTGSDAQGRVMAGKTCADWTSSEAGMAAQVGHSDGLGPQQNPAPPYNSWNSSHESGGCHDTAMRGGSGRTYCFARN